MTDKPGNGKGMLWFDNDPKTSLEEKIQKALDYYRNKYKVEPTLCTISSKNFIYPLPKIEGIGIFTSSSVLLHHFIIR